MKPLPHILFTFIFSLFTLVLASCASPGNGEHKSGSDSSFSRIPVNIPVRKNKTFDYTKLYGTWVLISSHENNDTLISQFLPDTDQTKSKYGYYRVQEFDSTGKWHLRDDDIGYGGTFGIDSVAGAIKIYTGYPQTKLDSTLYSRIIYLSKDYTLTEYAYPKKKFVDFFMNIKARNNWKFAKGG